MKQLVVGQMSSAAVGAALLISHMLLDGATPKIYGKKQSEKSSFGTKKIRKKKIGRRFTRIFFFKKTRFCQH